MTKEEEVADEASRVAIGTELSAGAHEYLARIGVRLDERSNYVLALDLEDEGWRRIPWACDDYRVAVDAGVELIGRAAFYAAFRTAGAEVAHRFVTARIAARTL